MMLIPPADLDVPGLGSVQAGVAVDVPDHIAGRPEDPRREAAMIEHAAAVAAINHEAAARLRDEIIDLDMGEGLLAQGWLRAPTTKTPKDKTASDPGDNKETDPR